MQLMHFKNVSLLKCNMRMHSEQLYKRVVNGGSRSRFTENKTVLSQFMKNRHFMLLGKKENVLLKTKVTYGCILKNDVQSKPLLVVFTIRPLHVL